MQVASAPVVLLAVALAVAVLACDGADPVVHPADAAITIECGDRVCHASEIGDCAVDCGEVPPGCGDGTCGPLESGTSCPADCATTCGDMICAAGETFGTCPADCGPPCGDGVCTPPESNASCVQDCPVCGDGACTSGETPASCAPDCTCLPVCVVGPPHAFDACADEPAINACVDDVCGNTAHAYCCVTVWDQECVKEATLGFCCE